MFKIKGFTLIELMIVVAIIGILATMSVPTFQDRIIRAQISEALTLTEGIKKTITEYYSFTQQFPLNNQEANLPKPEHLIGNFIKSMSIEKGAIHVKLGNRINSRIAGKMLTLRPAVVSGSPTSPISWLCGNAKAVNGMEAVGENKTNVPELYLMIECRTW